MFDIKHLLNTASESHFHFVVRLRFHRSLVADTISPYDAYIKKKKHLQKCERRRSVRKKSPALTYHPPAQNYRF